MKITCIRIFKTLLLYVGGACVWGSPGTPVASHGGTQ